MSEKVPQLLVTISPEGELIVEAPGGGPTRKQVRLPLDSAGIRLRRMLLDQQRVIEAEGREARKPRARPQPNWELIAKHPEVEIRRVKAAGTGAGKLSQTTVNKSVEELGL